MRAAGQAQNQPEAPPRGMVDSRLTRTSQIIAFFHGNPLAGLGAPAEGI